MLHRFQKVGSKGWGPRVPRYGGEITRRGQSGGPNGAGKGARTEVSRYGAGQAGKEKTEPSPRGECNWTCGLDMWVMFIFRDTKQHRFSRGCSTHRCQLHVFSVRYNHTSRTVLLDEQLNLIPLSRSSLLLDLLALIASLLGLHRLWCCSGCGCLLHRFHRHLRISCWTDQKQGS